MCRCESNNQGYKRSEDRNSIYVSRSPEDPIVKRHGEFNPKIDGQNHCPPNIPSIPLPLVLLVGMVRPPPIAARFELLSLPVIFQGLLFF